MKKGKKRKLIGTEAVIKEGEKRRKDGSGGGCASYLHLRLEIEEGGEEVDLDLSPEYMENHLTRLQRWSFFYNDGMVMFFFQGTIVIDGFSMVLPSLDHHH